MCHQHLPYNVLFFQAIGWRRLCRDEKLTFLQAHECRCQFLLANRRIDLQWISDIEQKWTLSGPIGVVLCRHFFVAMQKQRLSWMLKDYPWRSQRKYMENTEILFSSGIDEEVKRLTWELGSILEHFINGGGSGNMLCRRIHWRSGLSSLGLGLTVEWSTCNWSFKLTTRRSKSNLVLLYDFRPKSERFLPQSVSHEPRQLLYKPKQSNQQVSKVKLKLTWTIWTKSILI